MKKIILPKFLERFTGLFINPIKGSGMIGCFQVFNQGFTTHRNSFFNNHGSLPTGKGISLKRITGVGKFYPEPFTEITDKFTGHLPCPINYLFFLGKPGD